MSRMSDQYSPTTYRTHHLLMSCLTFRLHPCLDAGVSEGKPRSLYAMFCRVLTGSFNFFVIVA